MFCLHFSMVGRLKGKYVVAALENRDMSVNEEVPDNDHGDEEPPLMATETSSMEPISEALSEQPRVGILGIAA